MQSVLYIHVHVHSVLYMFPNSSPVIHHVERGVCVGVVNTVHYCHYSSGRQPGQCLVFHFVCSLLLFTHYRDERYMHMDV